MTTKGGIKSGEERVFSFRTERQISEMLNLSIAIFDANAPPDFAAFSALSPGKFLKSQN